MSDEKKSKRQERREKIKKQETRRRLVTLGFMTLGAALLVLVFIYPQLKGVGELVTPAPSLEAPRDGLSIGNPDAPALIEAFEDLQCPACKSFTENTEPLIIQYLVLEGKARFVYRHYPFLDGPDATSVGESDQAANATMCANEQGKFWEMQAMIFANWNGENQGNLNNRRLEGMAEAVGLEMTAFNSCFGENKYEDEIQADFDLGNEMGVTGTPSVFVNGEKVGQPGRIPSFQEIAVAVDLIVNNTDTTE